MKHGRKAHDKRKEKTNMKKFYVETLVSTIIEVEADNADAAMDEAEVIADEMNRISYKANSGNGYRYIDSVRTVGADTEKAKLYSRLYA